MLARYFIKLTARSNCVLRDLKLLGEIEHCEYQ